MYSVSDVWWESTWKQVEQTRQKAKYTVVVYYHWMIEKRCLLGLLDLSPNVMIEPRKQKIITVIIIIHKRRCDLFLRFMFELSLIVSNYLLPSPLFWFNGPNYLKLYSRSNLVIRNIFLSRSAFSSFHVSNILKDNLVHQRTIRNDFVLMVFYLYQTSDIYNAFILQYELCHKSHEKWPKNPEFDPC